jgi:transcriptional regulator with XRE-family HTH domain
VGDHLRKARLLRGLVRREAGAALGVSVATLLNWEGNHTRVQTRFMPKVVAFLGYDPARSPDSLASGCEEFLAEE